VPLDIIAGIAEFSAMARNALIVAKLLKAM